MRFFGPLLMKSYVTTGTVSIFSRILGAETGSMFSLNVREEDVVNVAEPALTVDELTPFTIANCAPGLEVPIPTLPAVVTANREAVGAAPPVPTSSSRIFAALYSFAHRHLDP